MTFRPAIWFPIALVLSIINVVAAGFAARQAEPSHTMIHASLAVAFGLWAQRLRQGRGGSEPQARLDTLDAIDAIEAEMSTLRQELGEMQERLDFVERVLAQGPETRRVGPEGP